ncbi:conserved hypothetical protein [Verticillium alfalfae VaMs.102]|uniref:Conserved oligomeric Golgi complex subunit 2 n=1 Tax=Verticillium alfalfae (strain VaMs.102 / ATCC MYA-4576 / FGSC 10136) TaxID=526221 RepID=C9SNL1_VERA1|nr:conserved hypothetical protein [Verticillium alfalfae VaMs.102]EEY20376.1 conserved hypothetical protein [Verticillium alfalfae VaMs.102]
MTGLGIKSPTAAFHMASSSSSSNSSEDDDAPLPFPEALPRSDFLATDFDPASYLSNLPHRHQTLDDLKGDLRERSGPISAELLEPVNSNYTAFLSLGDELRGGRLTRLKDVKVVYAGVSALEEKLAVASLPGKVPAHDADDDDAWSVASSEDSDAEDDEVYTGLVGTSPSKLSGLAHDYCIIEALADVTGRDTPFVTKMESRMMRCRNTLLLDLNAALKESRKAGDKGKSRLVQYLGLYGLLDAEAEAVKALKGK